MVLFLTLIANDIKIGNSTLYDLTYKNLLEPNNIGTFIHHALVDAIQAGQDDNFQIMLSNVKKMMTAKEKDLGLVFMTPIFGLNDFSNMDFFEHFELDHGFMHSEWQKLLQVMKGSRRNPLTPVRWDHM